MKFILSGCSLSPIIYKIYYDSNSNKVIIIILGLISIKSYYFLVISSNNS